MKTSRILDLNEFEESEKVFLKDLLCPICKGVFRNPILSSNGKCFCKECFYSFNKEIQIRNSSSQEDVLMGIEKGQEEIIEKKLICPITKEIVKADRIREISVLRARIENFKIFCTNKSQNCEWKGLLKDRSEHLSKCLKEVIPCKYLNCKFFELREIVQMHQINCPLRRDQCQHCGFEYLYTEEEAHLNECLLLKLPCINGCGENVQRQNMENHLKDSCNNTMINCPLKLFNICCESCLRKDLPSHFLQEMINHFLHLAEGFYKLDKKMDLEISSFNNRNDFLVKNLNILKEKMENLAEGNFNTANLESKINENEEKIKSVEKKIIEITENFENLEQKLNLKNEETEKRIEDLKRKLEEEIISLKNTITLNENKNENEKLFLGNKRRKNKRKKSDKTETESEIDNYSISFNEEKEKKVNISVLSNSFCSFSKEINSDEKIMELDEINVDKSKSSNKLSKESKKNIFVSNKENINVIYDINDKKYLDKNNAESKKVSENSIVDKNLSSSFIKITDNILTAIGEHFKNKYVFLKENLKKDFKFNVLIKKITSWFAIGACYPTIAEKNQFIFKGFPPKKHGSYLISFEKGNNYSWNCLKLTENNCKQNSFQITSGTILSFKFFFNEKILQIEGNNQIFNLTGIKIYEKEQLKPCLILSNPGDEIEILESK